MKIIHYKISTIILAILLVGSVVFIIQNSGLSAIKKIPAQEAGQKVVSYINENVLQDGEKASLINASEDKEKGLYKLELNVEDQLLETYITLDGSTLFPNAIDLSPKSAANAPKASANPPAGETVDGDFIKVANPEILKENGKPVVYFFGSDSCPHCHWEFPVIKAVADKFGDKIVFRDNMTNGVKDTEIFSKFSNGAVPTIVIAGVYYRVGSGEQIGEEKETEVLTKLIQEVIDQTK